MRTIKWLRMKGDSLKYLKSKSIPASKSGLNLVIICVNIDYTSKLNDKETKSCCIVSGCTSHDRAELSFKNIV